MKIMVTGGAGFLGSHVCERFRQRGDEVIAYDNLTKFEINRTTYNVEKVRKYNVNFLESIGAKLVVADIRDYRTLLSNIEGCDSVMHCAAQPAMTIATENPLYDFDVNAKGTLNVLEACRLNKIPMLNCSSIHVYGTGINQKLKENETRYSRYPAVVDEYHPTLTGEITPLHASKITTENYVRTYAETYGMKCATFRLTGMYAERQCGTEEHSWMSLLAIKTLLGQPIQLIGTGKQVRDPIYAGDVVDAIEKWFKEPKPDVFNIGGSVDTMISVLEYLDLLYRITGKRSELLYGAERFGDLFYYVSDIDKAGYYLGWKPKTSLLAGVETMVAWLKDNLDMFGG